MCNFVRAVVWRFLSFLFGNSITLVSLVVLYHPGLHFLLLTILCVALQISEQFSPKAKTPTHWMPSPKHILTHTDHSRSLNVIYFGVSEEPLWGYKVQYNNCGLEYEGQKFRKIIAGKVSENCHFRQPHSHLKPPRQRTPANIRINLILLETAIPWLHYCRWQYGSIFIQFFVIGSERHV